MTDTPHPAPGPGGTLAGVPGNPGNAAAGSAGAPVAGAAHADEAGLRAELAALREDVAVCAPRVRSALAVAGEDHVAWLDRISSMPVLGLPAGRATGATLMDGKGKLRADLRVLNVATPEGGPPRLLLDVPASQHAALLRVLDMYILRDKVTLQDLGASHAWVSVLGPRADALLAAAGLPAPHGDEALTHDGGRQPGGAGDGGGTVSGGSRGSITAACASRLCGAPGADLLVPAAEVEPLLARLESLGARRVGTAVLEVERLARGVPWFSSELSDGVIPLEAGLDADVSVTKGCYPGQEVVARITNLGQVARRLARLSAPGRAALAAGTPLLGTGERQGQDAGRLTASAYDPLAQRTLALGYLRRAFWPPGTTVLAGETELTVAALR